MFPGKFEPKDDSMFHIPDVDVNFIKRKYLDLAYANTSGAQKLDIYLPEKGEGPFPVIVQIHGGAFAIGDKRDIHLAAFLEGINKGFAVVSVNYRLSHEARFPAAVEDVKAAIRWLRANQAQYYLDGKKIVACGGSAGGNLAAMLGVTGLTKEFDNPELGNTGFSSDVQTVVDLFGPINFLAMDEQLKANGLEPSDHNEPASPESRYLGAPIQTIPEVAKKSNPETYIHAGIPPFFIQHGRNDNLVPMQQSMNFARQLAQAGNPDKVIFEIIEDAGHGDPKFEDKKNMEKIFKFIEACTI